ncbi:hypothetical protein JCM11251_000847 [Rhodosporidiobolus azoricus]
MPDFEADDMSETKYAFLVMGKACQVCGTTKCNTQADHSVRVRACHKCLQAVLRTEAYIRDKHPDVHNQAFDCALQTPYSAAGEIRRDRAPYFYLPEVLAISKHLISLETVATANEADDVDTANSPQAYVKERKQLKEKVDLDATTIFGFESRSLDDSLALEREKRKERITAIDDKLAELGCTQRECYDMHGLYRVAYESTRALSEQEWDSLRPAMLAKLQKYRADKAEDAACQQLELYYHQMSLSLPAAQQVTFLPLADFLRLPTVEPLWNSDNPSVSLAAWLSKKQTVKREALAVMEQNKLDLFKLIASQLLQDGSPLPDPVKAALNDEAAFACLDDAIMDPIFARVTALFSCAVCHHKHPFPTIYRHVISSHATYDRMTPIIPEVDCLLPHANFRSAVLAMLRRENMDETTTTTEDLEALGERFVISGSNGKVYNKSWAFLTRDVSVHSYWWYRRHRLQRDKMPPEESYRFLELKPLPAPLSAPARSSAETRARLIDGTL